MPAFLERYNRRLRPLHNCLIVYSTPCRYNEGVNRFFSNIKEGFP